MQQIKKIVACPNDQTFVTYCDKTTKEINSKELSLILKEKENSIKRWTLIGNIQVIEFKN